MNSEKFILINLNQSISKARQATLKEQRSKWLTFGFIIFCYLALIGWFFEINNRTNSLITARTNTINKIKLDTERLQKDAKINLSKKDINSSYDLGKTYIPWSKKLMQLSEMTPFNMCITKLNYTNNALNISAISKIENKNVKEMALLNDFMNTIKSNTDFYREFDKITIEKTKKLESQGSPYLSFEIKAKLKNKIKNRLDDTEINNKIKKIAEDEGYKNTHNTTDKIKKEKRKTITSKNYSTDSKASSDLDKEKKNLEKIATVIESKNKSLMKKEKTENDKKSFSNEIVVLAKSISESNPDKQLVEEFQKKLSIYSSGHSLYGVYDAKTILKRAEVLGIKSKTKFEKRFEQANRNLSKINSSKKNDDNISNSKSTENIKTIKTDKRKYDKLTIKIAKEIHATGYLNPDPEKVKRFQDLAGISSEGKSDYGDFNAKTIEVWRDVLKEAK